MADDTASSRIAASDWFDAEWYRRTYAAQCGQDIAAAQHYLSQGAALGFNPGPKFDGLGYAQMQGGLLPPGENPLVHYERKTQGPAQTDYAVLVHAFHPHTFAELRKTLYAFPPSVDVYVSHPPEIADLVAEAFPGYFCVPVANKAQDFGGFLQALDALPKRYDFYCKIHSKSGDKWPDVWRAALLDGVAGSAARVQAVAALFRNRPDLVLAGGKELFLAGPAHLLENAGHLETLVTRAGYDYAATPTDWGFFAGSMFWIRDSAARTLRSCIDLETLEAQPVARDGQVAHALERFAGLIPAITHSAIALLPITDVAAPPECVTGFPTDIPRERRFMASILPALQTAMIADKTRRMAAGELPGLGFSRSLARPRRGDDTVGDFAAFTPTGDRPEAFQRCMQMVLAQTVQPRQWVVVDDGQVPLTAHMPLPDWVTYIRREPVKGDPPHTLSSNILAGLDHITPDTVVVFEDDDWYAPHYAEFVLSQIGGNLLFGVQPIRYYHLGVPGWINGTPPQHTAFAQSTFRRGHAWDHLAAVCRTGFQEIRETGVLDRHWWQTFEGAKTLVGDAPCLHVGFKGGFGRVGRAEGHRAHDLNFTPDPDAAYLKSMIGSDQAIYAAFQKTPKAPFALYAFLDDTGGVPDCPDTSGLFDCFLFSPTPVTSAKGWHVLPTEIIDSNGMPRAPFFPELFFPGYGWSVWANAQQPTGPSPLKLVTAGVSNRISVVAAGGPREIHSLARRHGDPGLRPAMLRWWAAQERTPQIGLQKLHESCRETGVDQITINVQ